MSNPGQWLMNLGGAGSGPVADGLVLVQGFVNAGHTPEEVAIIEKAKVYGAHAVFFEAARDGKPPVAQAFISTNVNCVTFGST